MKTTILLEKFFLDEKEFITSDELREYCNSFNLDYGNVLKYFLSRGYLLRIFKGIFYIRNSDELRFGSYVKYNHLELVSKGLELKGVKEWYFGLYTALKLNNMTHEYFVIDDIINDSLFRGNVMKINGRKFKFTKLKPELLNFGIIENKYRYSDVEKTILDFIYIWIYNRRTREEILIDISEYINKLSEEKIKKYVECYPNSVKEIVEKIF